MSECEKHIVRENGNGRLNVALVMYIDSFSNKSRLPKDSVLLKDTCPA